MMKKQKKSQKQIKSFMPNFFFALLLSILIITPSKAITERYDWFQVYKNLPKINVEFIHNEDPDEYYDYQQYQFSPYPLIRTSSNLYCQDILIPPGYYLLTPREYNGIHAILFKQKGKIKFVIPVYKKETVVPELLYKEPPKPKTPWWKWTYKWFPCLIKKILGTDKYKQHIKYPKTKFDAYDLYGPFYEMDLYYNDGLYRMIFRKDGY